MFQRMRRSGEYAWRVPCLLTEESLCRKGGLERKLVEKKKESYREEQKYALELAIR